MQTFKDFLESSGDFMKNSLYSSQADSWNVSNNAPSNLKFLQNRWETEKSNEGRPFHNIDFDTFKQVKYQDVQSTEMPEVGSGFWTHKDQHYMQSSLCVKDVDLEYDYPPPPKLDYKLNQLFGDCPETEYDLPDNFDEPWVKSHES